MLRMGCYANDVHHIDFYRALGIISDFYDKLREMEEKHLIIATERLLRLLKSRFFQALFDIREFYLISVSKAENYLSWEIPQQIENDEALQEIKNAEKIDDSCLWEDFDVCIKRGKSGLGFSIAGGIDNPHNVNSFEIIVTKISKECFVTSGNKLEVNDVIKKVNHFPLANMKHTEVVEKLKSSGENVTLSMSRIKRKNDLNEILLIRNSDGYGFSIAGGRDNQHYPEDSSIYITKIVKDGVADIDGRIKVGQKIVSIFNSDGYRSFEDVTHEEAVTALKCSNDKIILYIDKKTEMETNQIIPEGQLMIAPDDSKPENDSKIYKRTICLKKCSGSYGFNIIGGENEEGIFVSSVMIDKPAYIDKQLKDGDQIMRVNEIDFQKVTHNEAVAILKDTEEVTLVVESNIEGYEKVRSRLTNSTTCTRENKIINIKKNLLIQKQWVKVLFDYDPKVDDDLPCQGLLLNFGDILYLKNASDDEWWMAQKIFPEYKDELGIIPSNKRWERKQRARERCVKFEENMSTLMNKTSFQEKKKKNYTFSRKFPFMKNKDEKFEDTMELEQPYLSCYTQDTTELIETANKEILYRVELPYMEELTLVYLENDNADYHQQLSSEDDVNSYIEVEERSINYTRPVIIFGPLKDQINDSLISDHPDKFECCIPHTTRSKKNGEIDGQDYHFVESRETMENDIKNNLFIEAGQYNGNLYGTSISSIKKIAYKDKHCILDVSENAMKRLYAAELYPIALLIKLESFEVIMKINEAITEHQAKMIFNRSIATEQDFSEYITATITGESFQDLYDKVEKSIYVQSQKNKVFVPRKKL